MTVNTTYLKIEEIGKSTSGITKIFRVSSNRESDIIKVPLGIIKWLGAWRKYCFYPDDSKIFDSGCLREIADFCAQQTKEQLT